MKHLFSAAWLLSSMLLCTACGSEESAGNSRKTTGAETIPDKTIQDSVALSTFSTISTRTSYDYDTRVFYWEPGDAIYLKDDDGNWQRSRNTIAASLTPSANFRVAGTYDGSDEYTVFYPGTQGVKDTVYIAKEQKQTSPNSTAHFGASGDCGMATARRASGNIFNFNIEHKVTYLAFIPYSTNDIINQCYLQSITVKSTDFKSKLSGTFTLDPVSGTLKESSKYFRQVELVTRGTGETADGFKLSSKTPNVAVTGSYIVIPPGRHKLTIEYRIYDKRSGALAVYTKKLAQFDYKPNMRYDFKHEITAVSYDDALNCYYTWDAEVGKHYWYGDRTAYLAFKMSSSPNYPKDSSDERWYNPVRDENNYTVAATRSCKDCPNINLMRWYVEKGDPYWDNTPWTRSGYVFSGGIWLKKASVIAAENGITVEQMSEVGPDKRTDYRTVNPSHASKSSKKLGTPPNKNDYFYLPALGSCQDGYIMRTSDTNYASSTAGMRTRDGGEETCVTMYFFATDKITLTPSSSIGLGQGVTIMQGVNFTRRHGAVVTPDWFK